MASQYRQRNYEPFDLMHFTVRGHNRRRIFHDQADHDEFLAEIRRRLNAQSTPNGPKLLGYAQMSNHQHVFMDAGEHPLIAPKIMRGASTSYALSYNDRYGRSGPVFQRP